MNLHDIVRKSITAVHDDKALTLIKYEGKQNNFGVFSTVYKKYEGLKGNFQPDDVKDTYINNTVENETITLEPATRVSVSVALSAETVVEPTVILLNAF